MSSIDSTTKHDYRYLMYFQLICRILLIRMIFELNKRFSKTYICFLKSFIFYHTLQKRLFSYHFAILELIYPKSRKSAYP
jgi:hypothetical protein